MGKPSRQSSTRILQPATAVNVTGALDAATVGGGDTLLRFKNDVPKGTED